MPPTQLGIEQYQFTDTGLILNSAVNMPFVDITQVEGLLDSAPLRLTQKDHEGRNGGFINAFFEQMRTIVLTGTIYCDPNQFETYLDQLKQNYAPASTPQPLYFQTDAGLRLLNCKSAGVKAPRTNARSYGKQDFTITLVAEDPRTYSAGSVSSGPIYLGSVIVAGRGYPKAYTYGYGSAATQSAGVITPGGTRTTPGNYIITGPIVNPSIVNDTLGLTWTFNITLAATDQLVISPDLRTVRLGVNGPSRRYVMAGPWWELGTGPNNFRLLGSGGNSNTNLTITAQAAWR